MATPEMNPVFASTLLLQENDPSWSGLEGLRSACLGMVLLDIELLAPDSDLLFTPREAARASRMGPRRRNDFTAARVALKGLARQLGLVDKNRPDWTIETLGPDGEKPCLGASDICCSASHSARFAVAAAHRRPLGVDIETVSNKLMRTRHIYLRPAEQNRMSLSNLSPEQTSARAWTAKEAAAKALGLQLFAAFREVEVVRFGENEGVVKYQGKAYPVKHAEGRGQVITLLNADVL